jgi:hypothetical protein
MHPKQSKAQVQWISTLALNIICGERMRTSQNRLPEAASAEQVPHREEVVQSWTEEMSIREKQIKM